MKYLLKRMIRDIKQNFGKFISIVLILGVGSFVFSGLLSSIQAINDNVSKYYEKQNLADLWAYYSAINENDINSMVGESGITEAEGRLSLSVTIYEKDAKILTYGNINKPRILNGVMPESDNQVLLDKAYANAQNITLNSTLNVTYKDVSYNYEVVGLCEAPDYAYKTKTLAGGVVTNKEYAVIFASDNQIRTMENTFISGYYSEVLIKSNDIDTTVAYLETTSNFLKSFKRDQVFSYNMIENSINPIRSVSNIIPFVFYFVAAIVTFISMTKSIENERTQIAVMQAIGIKKIQIVFAYLFYALIASILGSFVFSAIGNYVLSTVIINALMGRFNLPPFTIPYYFNFALGGFLLGFAFSALAILISLVRVLREIPAQAMRPRPPKKTHRTMVERMPFIWNKLKYYQKLNVRNIFLGKMRIALTSIGVIGGVGLLIMSFSLSNAVGLILKPITDTYSYDLAVTYQTRNITDIDSLDFGDFTIDYKEKSTTLNAIKDEETENNIFIQLVNVDSQAVVLSSSKGKIDFNKDSFVVNGIFKKEYGLHVGDDFSFIYNDVQYNIPITDISTECLGSTVYMSYDKAQELGLDTSSNKILLKLHDQSKIEDLYSYLHEKDEVAGIERSSEMIKTAKQIIHLLRTIVVITIIASAVLSVTVIYNITSINIFERTREFATLMVLGYYKNEVYKLIIVENIIVAVIGCILGTPVGIFLFNLIADAIGSMNIIMPTTISVGLLFVSYGLTIVFSILALVLSRSKVNNIQMVEALKSVE